MKKDATCKNCYADTLAHRFNKHAWGHAAPRLFLSQKTQNAPLRWQREAEAAGEYRLVFCGSMKDLLEPRRELDAEREAIWEMIDRTPNLIWLLLTKRAEQMSLLYPARWFNEWPRNVWPGVSAGTQDGLNVRLPFLAALPAPVIFLSLEPLIQSVRLSAVQPLPRERVAQLLRAEYDAEQAYWYATTYDVIARDRPWESRNPRGTWVIVGGESGPHARPMHPKWARDLRDEARAVGSPYYLKQWGNWAAGGQELPGGPALGRANFGTLGSDGQWTYNEYSSLFGFPDLTCMYEVGKHVAGHLLDGQEYREHPAVLQSFYEKIADDTRNRDRFML